jgi:RNA polymerase sigma-B factor
VGKGGLTSGNGEERARASETVALLRAYHERGDKDARERLVQLYLPLVESFTRRYARTADEHDDLYQVGCIGLINSIDRFELSRGDELAAFAVPNIAGEIRRYLRDRGGTVRLPRRIVELRPAATQAQADLRAKLKREPTTSEVAAEVGAEERDVSLALDGSASRTLELQPGDTSGEMLGATDDRLFLTDAFRGLDERERRIVYMRYIQDAEPDAIAAELGITRRQLGRTTEQALKKLRSGLEKPAAAPTGADSHAAPPSRVEPKMDSRPAAQDEQQIDQRYHIELVQAEAGDGWTAKVEELPGCTADGATPEEAAARVHDAMRTWIADAVAQGREVPKPRAMSHSGRLLVRMPQSLHAELARAAEREEVSLNQFITSSLASAVHWRGTSGEASTSGAAPTARRTGATRTALIVNVVLLVLIALLAIALLVVAVTRG